MKRSEVEDARTICGSCPVRRDCLQDALELREEFGVRGGYTAPERQRAEEQMGRNPEAIMAMYDVGELDGMVRRL